MVICDMNQLLRVIETPTPIAQRNREAREGQTRQHEHTLPLCLPLRNLISFHDPITLLRHMPLLSELSFHSPRHLLSFLSQPSQCRQQTMRRRPTQVSLEHFTAAFLFPEDFCNDVRIASFCSVVLGLDDEAFALGYGGWHVLL